MTMSNAMQKLVVGIDFAEEGQLAFEAAARLLPADGEFHLVHVLPGRNAKAHLAEDERLLRDAYSRLKTLVHEKGGPLFPTGWSGTVGVHVRLGDPADAILQVAVDVDADLVVVGTRGLKGVARLVLGSVASKLITQGNVPVLVARPKNYEGLSRTPQIEPPRPGQNMHEERADLIYSSEHLSIAPSRTTHVSGLI